MSTFDRRGSVELNVSLWSTRYSTPAQDIFQLCSQWNPHAIAGCLVNYSHRINPRLRFVWQTNRSLITSVDDILTYLHTCVHAFIHTLIHAYTLRPKYLHRKLHTYMHTYIYTHIYTHTYKHTYSVIHAICKRCNEMFDNFTVTIISCIQKWKLFDSLTCSHQAYIGNSYLFFFINLMKCSVDSIPLGWLGTCCQPHR